MERENKKPVTLNLAPSIKEYIGEQAIKFGMSNSAFVTMVISQYRQQNDVLAELSKFKDYMSQLQDISNKQLKREEE